jgi:5'-nucleotidase
LIVSGINKGGNMGDDVTYSGTVSAAFEGTLLGIPSFAISIDARSHFKFHTAACFAVRVARYITKKGLPRDTFLNINVPNVDEKGVKSYKITQQGKWTQNGNAVVEKIDPRGKKYYWIAGGRQAYSKRGDTDIKAVSNSYISITPMHLDLTDYASMNLIRKWKL